MSVDVEDYFQVSAFDASLSRRSWDELESRVVANTDRLLALFDDGRRARDLLRARLGRRALPGAGAAHRRAGHEIASHGYGHRLVYDQTRDAFREDVRRAKALLEDAVRRARCTAIARRATRSPRSLWALDVLIEEGYSYDASIFPMRHDRYGIPVSGAPVPDRATQARSSRRPDRRRVSARSIFRCRRRVLPPSSVLVDEVRHSTREPARTSAGDLLPPSVGNRSRSAAARGRASEPLPSLPESERDGSACADCCVTSGSGRSSRCSVCRMAWRRRHLKTKKTNDESRPGRPMAAARPEAPAVTPE